jgi:hypothetical protein
MIIILCAACTYCLPAQLPLMLLLTDFFILVNKTNKYNKLVISLLGFAQIARPEFETRVRDFFFFTFVCYIKNKTQQSVD